MRRNSRQDAINRLREQQDPFNRHFDKFDDTFDKAFDSPGRFFFKFGLLAIVLNLLFWGTLIFFVLYLLSHFGVI